MTQLFDLNAKIQQFALSLIFYEKRFHKPIVLVSLATGNLGGGGVSNFCRYYTRSQTGKRTGYRPTLKSLHGIAEILLKVALNINYTRAIKVLLTIFVYKYCDHKVQVILNMFD